MFAADGHGSVRMLLNMAAAVATIAGMRQLCRLLGSVLGTKSV